MSQDDEYYDDDDDYGSREAKAARLKNSNIWVTVEEGKYTSAHGVVDSLPSGAYEINLVMGQPIFARIDMNAELLTKFNDKTYDNVMRDIERFWEARAKFAAHGIAHKRGILLHGPPGTGKSCIVRLIVDDVVARGGVAVRFGDVGSYISGMQMLRRVAPKMPVVVIMEDVECILRYNESTILNVLDGMYGIDGVVYLATTNHLDRLQERIKNRPSRFDKRLLIGCPERHVRLEYIKRLDTTETTAPVLDAAAAEKWADDTDGFSFGHIKELYISTVLFENAYDDVLTELRSMYSDGSAPLGDDEDDSDREED